MCNFIHKKKNGRQFELGRSCDVEKFCNEQGISVQDTLPHDIDNFCIFHSKNQSWKSSLSINDTIQKLSSNFLDGGSFNFFPFTESEFYDNIDISNKKIEKNLNFSYSIFHKNLNIENIEGTITGKEITVKEKLSIKNSPKINSAVFNNSNIRELVINSANFKDSVIFSDCYISESFEIKNSNFYSYTLFDNININADSANGKFIYIGQDSSFNENLDFSGATFNGQLVFRDVKLKHADFVNIKTLESPDYSNIVYESVSFFSVTVMEFGKVNFKGTTNLKLFNQGVIFQNFKVDGLVEFENVDFQKIAPASRKDLINQSKGGNIIIGGGCLKYRHQTDIISHVTGSLTQKLIEDMTNTYINFFTKHNGINLGFEIIEKTTEKIAYFYFSDENISEEQFYQYLRYTESDMWSLVRNETPKQAISNDLHIISKNETKYFDYTKASMASIFYQFGLGLSYQDTIPQELEQLVESIGISKSINKEKVDYLLNLIKTKFNIENLTIQFIPENMTIGEINNYGGNQNFADTIINNSNILSTEDVPFLKLIHDNVKSKSEKTELVKALESIKDDKTSEIEKSQGKELWKKFLESGVSEVAKEAIKALSPALWAMLVS